MIQFQNYKENNEAPSVEKGFSNLFYISDFLFRTWHIFTSLLRGTKTKVNFVAGIV